MPQRAREGDSAAELAEPALAAQPSPAERSGWDARPPHGTVAADWLGEHAVDQGDQCGGECLTLALRESVQDLAVYTIGDLVASGNLLGTCGGDRDNPCPPVGRRWWAPRIAFSLQE